MSETPSERPIDLVRRVFDAFIAGDLTTIRETVSVDLEWIFLDPTMEDPEPRTCHGRQEFEQATRRWSHMELHSAIEEIDAAGSNVVVIMHAPGLDQFRARFADDRNFHVATVRDNKVVTIRACRNRDEARAAAGLTAS